MLFYLFVLFLCVCFFIFVILFCFLFFIFIYVFIVLLLFLLLFYFFMFFIFYVLSIIYVYICHIYIYIHHTISAAARRPTLTCLGSFACQFECFTGAARQPLRGNNLISRPLITLWCRHDRKCLFRRVARHARTGSRRLPPIVHRLSPPPWSSSYAYLLTPLHAFGVMGRRGSAVASAPRKCWIIVYLLYICLPKPTCRPVAVRPLQCEKQQKIRLCLRSMRGAAVLSMAAASQTRW